MQKVGQVVVVAFGVQVGTAVLHGALLDDARYRDELRQPITLFGHGPIEQRPGGAAIAIAERVVIGQHEMQGDGPDHRMQKFTACLH